MNVCLIINLVFNFAFWKYLVSDICILCEKWINAILFLKIQVFVTDMVTKLLRLKIAYPLQIYCNFWLFQFHSKIIPLQSCTNFIRCNFLDNICCSKTVGNLLEYDPLQKRLLIYNVFFFIGKPLQFFSLRKKSVAI